MELSGKEAEPSWDSLVCPGRGLERSRWGWDNVRAKGLWDGDTAGGREVKEED